MSTYMVTGGAGFIGSHVTDLLLAQGHEVTVVDDLSTGTMQNLVEAERCERLSFHHMDLRSQQAADLVREVCPEVILMLGAQMSVKVSMRDPRLDAEINVLGLINIVEAAVTAKTRKVVLASSGGTIYGSPPADQLPLDEDVAGSPTSFYGLTKRMGGEYLRLFRENHGLEYVALALGNVYGPRQDPRGEAGVVSIFAERLATGMPCIVNGDGLTTRDYVYVTDVAAAFVAAISHGSGLINIGTGIETSVLEVYSVLAEHVASQHPAQHVEQLNGEVRRVSLSPAKALAELGWQPTVDFRTGVRRLMDYRRLGGS